MNNHKRKTFVNVTPCCKSIDIVRRQCQNDRHPVHTFVANDLIVLWLHIMYSYRLFRSFSALKAQCLADTNSWNFDILWSPKQWLQVAFVGHRGISWHLQQPNTSLVTVFVKVTYWFAPNVHSRNDLISQFTPLIYGKPTTTMSPLNWRDWGAPRKSLQHSLDLRFHFVRAHSLTPKPIPISHSHTHVRDCVCLGLHVCCTFIATRAIVCDWWERERERHTPHCPTST